MAATFGPLTPWLPARPASPNGIRPRTSGSSTTSPRTSPRPTTWRRRIRSVSRSCRRRSTSTPRRTRSIRSARASGCACIPRTASSRRTRAGSSTRRPTRMPEFTAPGIGRENSTVTIDAEVGDNASGVLYALGGSGGGARAVHGQGTTRLRVQHDDHRALRRALGEQVPAGKRRIEVTTTLASAQPLSPAEVVLKVDGQEVARTTVKRTVPARFRRARRSTSAWISARRCRIDYFDRRPFKFDGKIQQREQCQIEMSRQRRSATRRRGTCKCNLICGGSCEYEISAVAERLLVGLALALPVLAAAQSSEKPFTNEQLDQMTAQVALYPDSLLAQLFMATTYPDEFAKAMAWSKAHPDAKGDDAVKMVENEPWDPAVASMVGFPEVLITLGEKPDWVKNMGDAFLAQPEAVMDSVQRLRAQAQKAGNLKSNEQVKVSTQAAEAAPAAAPQTAVVQQAAPPPQVIVIEPAQPSRRLRAGLQPDDRLRGVAVPGLPAVLLSAAAGLLVVAADRDRHSVGRGHRRFQRAVGRLRLGPARRRHQRQSLQQHQRRTGASTSTAAAPPGITIPSIAATRPTGAATRRSRTSTRSISPATASSIAARMQAAMPSRDRASQAMADRRCRRQVGGARQGAERGQVGGALKARRGQGRRATRRKAPIAMRRGKRHRTRIAMPRKQRAQASERDNALKGANSTQARGAGRSRGGEQRGRAALGRRRRQPSFGN